MNNKPVAIRYDFDGYGYQYMDSGSGSDWQTRVDGELLYANPVKELPTKEDEYWLMVEMLRAKVKEQQAEILAGKIMIKGYGKTIDEQQAEIEALKAENKKYEKHIAIGYLEELKK